MTANPRPTTGPELRALSRRLADAQDGQLARVLAVVDALPRRGAADDLIASFRPRLARMRPSRPLVFTRLLFSPLDPLLVPAPRWHPGLPNIPRSVLGPLAATVRAGLGAAAMEIDRLIAGRTMQDAAVLDEAGARLWPSAAHILAAAPPPVGWPETGLNPSIYPPLARRIAAVLAQCPALQALIAEAETGILPPRLLPVCAMLQAAGAQCAEALPAMLLLLLTRLPQAAALLPAVAARMRPHAESELRLAAEHATESLLQRLDGSGDAVFHARGLSETAVEAQRIVTLLRGLADTTTTPERRQRLGAIRERLDAICRAQFAHGMAAEFLAPLQALESARDAAATAAALEVAARHLRALESSARALGGGPTYDLLLRQAAAAATGEAALGPADRVRLVEILSGPEAALALLEMQERRTAG